MNSPAQDNGSQDLREEQSLQPDLRSAEAPTTTKKDKKDCGMLATPADYPRVLKYLGKVTMDKTGEKFDGSNTLKWQQLMRAVTVELRRLGLLAVVEGQVRIMVTSSVPRPGVTQQIPHHSVLFSSEPRGDRSSSSRTPSMLQRALALHQVGHLGDVQPPSLPRSIGELQVQHLANATPTGTLQPQRVLQHSQSALQQAPSLPMQALPGLSPDQQISGNTTMAPLSQSLPTKEIILCAEQNESGEQRRR